MTEQYQCQSYSDDNRVVQDCTCGKCGNTLDTEWEKEFDATFGRVDEYISDKPTYNHYNYIKYFITNLLTSRDKYWKERVRKESEKLEQIEKGAIKMLGAVINTVCGDGGSCILPIGWELQECTLEREILPDGRTSVRAFTTPITNEDNLK